MIDETVENPLMGPTPCKEVPNFYASPLLDGFDSQEFKESHPELEGKELEKALYVAEQRHQLLHRDAVEEAVKLCRSCPALRQCADWVLDFEANNGSVYGVVAGMEPHQRRKLRRKLDRLRTKNNS